MNYDIFSTCIENNYVKPKANFAWLIFGFVDSQIIKKEIGFWTILESNSNDERLIGFQDFNLKNNQIEFSYV